MAYKLNKPFSIEDRAAFVVAHQGMAYAEDDAAIYMLEENERFIDGKIVTLADEEYTALKTKREALASIVALEASVTDRRVREAVLGVDNGWLKNINDQIAVLRAQSTKDA